jgi:hypothetical protein
MSVQTFNSNLVSTRNELIDFTEYSNDIIKSVFAKNKIFNCLHKKSENKGFSIPSAFLGIYCNIKNTSTDSTLQNIGLKIHENYTKKGNIYFLTFIAFEKCVKEHCKEYQERMKEIENNYNDYCELYNQQSDSDKDSEESESDEDSSESESDEEENLDDVFNEFNKLNIIREHLQSFKRITGNESNIPEYVKHLNRELNISGILMPFLEYFKKLCTEHFKTEFEFTDELLAILRQEGCSIHHSMLIKYQAVTRVDHIIRSLERIGKIEGKDFKVLDKKSNLPHVGEVAGNRKGKTLIYMITPETFSALLQKTNKKDIGDTYRSFFTTLAKVADYYDEFGIEYQQKYQNIIKNKIKEREERQKRREKRLLKKKDKTIKKKNCKIDELKEMMVDMKKTMLEISKDLKTVISKVSEFKVPRGKQKDLQEVIGICKEPNTNNGYETYHVVRCQSKYYDTCIKDKREKYDARDLFRIDTNNSTLCWHSMKEYFAKNNRFVTDTYSFKYRGRIDEDGLKELLKDSVKTIKSQVSGR